MKLLAFLILCFGTLSLARAGDETAPLQPGLLTPILFVSTAQPPYGTDFFGPTAFERRVLRDLAYAGRTAVNDVAYIYSSPARINGRTALLLGGVLAVGAGVYLLDDDILRALVRNREEWPYKPIHELGEALEPVGRQAVMNKYVAGTAVVSYLLGFERLARMSTELMESYVIAGIPKVATNRIAGRPRPLDGDDWNHWDFFDTGQSFFSGHTSHAFQMARVLSANIDFWPAHVLFYGAATSIGLQRVSSQWHWPSDTFIGGIYGYVVADAILGHHRRSWTLEPTAFSGSLTPGACLTIRW